MAFGSASGYGNLPNGVWSPVIYSKQVQLAFRKSAICEAITNNDYFGEIANMGDSVKIVKEPEVDVKAYVGGATVGAQDLIASDFSLNIDRANSFAFKVDDIEDAHSQVNFQSLASDRAAYRLADQFDKDVLGYMAGYKQTPAAGATGNILEDESADTVNNVVNGTKANSAAGGDELLAANNFCWRSFNPSSCTSFWRYSITNSNCVSCDDCIAYGTFVGSTAS